MHTFFHNIAFHAAHQWVALVHFPLWMEAPTWAAAVGRGLSWPGWTASAWTGKTEPVLRRWSAHTDCAAAELRTTRGKGNGQLYKHYKSNI